MQDSNVESELQSWRNKVLIVGGVVGALVGLGAAYVYTQRADSPDHKPEFGTGDGVRLGLLVLGLLRSVSELGDKG